jgi:hypothetical protein
MIKRQLKRHTSDFYVIAYLGLADVRGVQLLCAHEHLARFAVDAHHVALRRYEIV